MAIRELDKIPTKALMARITAELEGLIVTDADGRYIYVNHRWSSLTGYTLDQVKGRYVRDIVRNSRVDEVLKSQKFVSGDAVLLNICTNEEVPVYCSYTPLFHDGEIEGCFVYMIIIGKIKREAVYATSQGTQISLKCGLTKKHFR